MKKLVLVLAGLGFAANASAADEVKWKMDGNIRAEFTSSDHAAQTTNATNDPAKAEENRFDHRAQLGVTAVKSEALMAKMMFNMAGNWGLDSGDYLTAANEYGDNKRYKASNEQNIPQMLEAYVWWKANDMMSWRFGRGGFTLADGTVVSKNETSQTPKVFDGVMGTFDFGFAGMNVFGVKGSELGTSATAFNNANVIYDREHNFYGLTLDFKNLPDFLKVANFHLIMEKQNPTATSNTAQTMGKDYTRYGLSLGGDMSGFDYRGTYAGQTGKKISYFGNQTLNKSNDEYKFTKDGYMVDLEAGYTFSEFWNTRVGLWYHMDSGDKDGVTTADQTQTTTAADETANGDKKDSTYDAFHYDFRKYNGLQNIFSFGNLTAIAVKIKAEPMENLKVGLDYFMLSRTSDKDTSNSIIGITHSAQTGGTVTSMNYNTKKDLGTELDLWVEKVYDGGFKMLGYYSMFTPGSYFKKSVATASGTETDMKVKNMTQFGLRAELAF